MKKTIAVDLDGTLAKFDDWLGIEHIGDPIEGAKEFLTSLKQEYNVLIWTTRCNPEYSGTTGYGVNLLQSIVREWLVKHEMPFDDIWVGTCKPLAYAFIDDRAINCSPQTHDDPTVAYNMALMVLKDARFGSPVTK